MRHRKANRKLGRTSEHRAALFRNQLASMIDRERIVTTLPKAKELRPIVEKIVTLAKTDSVHTRRMAARSIHQKDVLKKLFETIGPRFADRPGGYTRIIKLGSRRGDGAEMAILEFVDFEMGGKAAAEKTTKKKAKPAKAKSAPEETDEAPDVEAESEEAPKKKPAAKKPASKKPAAKKPATKKPAPKKPASKSGSKASTSSKKSASKKSSSGSKKSSRGS